jgi:hypothetical protein
MIPMLVLAAALAQAPGYYTAEEARQILAGANAAYARGDTVKAAEGYRRLAEHGFASADVLYNLGTSELALGELGPAVLHLERAKRAGGSAPDLAANLALARSRTVDHLLGGQGGEGLWRRLANAAERELLGWTLAGAVGLCCALWIMARLLGPRGRGLRWAAALPLLVALPSALLLAAHARAESDDRQAVVMAPVLPARELPAEGAKVLFELHPGLTVRVLERQAGLTRVRLPNDAEGWVDSGGLEEIGS